MMIYKRLTAEGRYRWPRNSSEVRNLTWKEFGYLMDGFTIEGTIKEIFPSKKTDLENSRTQD